MKQFLRYQISGTIFILWIVIFFYGENAKNLNELMKLLLLNLENWRIIAGLVITMPIGVLIHQLSVLIKNLIVSKIWDEFNDFPKRNSILKLSNRKIESIQYCLERVSNLNSFYYVRFDNGFLSPVIAWLFVDVFMGRDTSCTWELTAIFIGMITMIYLIRIHSEMKEYQKIINEISNNSIERDVRFASAPHADRWQSP
ncbi:MAG: hypothetical protein R8M11_00255 [Gallionella sp.]